jgi:hypothetical protein
MGPILGCLGSDTQTQRPTTAPAAAGSEIPSPSPATPDQPILITQPGELDAAVDRLVTLRGTVTDTKIPTLVNVDIESEAPDLRGSAASATGILRRRVVTQADIDRQTSEVGQFANRGPGTFYSLIDPSTGRVASAEQKGVMPASQLARSGCADRLARLIIRGDLSDGHGLSAGCTRADVETVLGVNGTTGSGSLSRLSYGWVKYGLAGKETEARVWYEGDAVILVDVGRPGVQQLADTLRAALGEPAATIQARVNQTHEEWIYPKRGLAIAVGKGLDDPADAPRRVSWLFLYAPTSLEDYVSRLGGKDEWVKRWPER